MKLGCCISMLGGKEEPIGQAYLPLVKAAGYDFVEIPLAPVTELAEEKFDELLEVLNLAGLPCPCCNIFFPADVRLTGAAVDLGQVEAYIRTAFLRAKRLGAATIVFGSGGARNVPEGFSHEHAFEQLVTVLKIADRYAGAYGLEIVIEPLNHLEGNIILDLSDGIKLMTAATFDNIFLLVDYYHYKIENDSLEILKESLPAIRHVHFAEPDGRCFPRQIKADYQDFFHLLKAGGYTGNVSIEAFSQNPEADLNRAVLLRQLL